MQVVNSLRSAKQRHPDCQLVKRKGRLYVICKSNPASKRCRGAKTPLTETLQRAALLAVGGKIVGGQPLAHGVIQLRPFAVYHRKPVRVPVVSFTHQRPGENVLRTETPAALPPVLMGY